MNAAIRSKTEELTKLGVQGDTLLAETKTTGLSPEIKVKLTAIRERITTLRKELDDEVKVEEAANDLKSLHNFLESPVARIPHGSNGTDSERKNYEQAGWEFKGGMAYKTTSTGRQVEMFSQDVLFGEIPEDIKRDPVASEFYRLARATMGDDYKTAYTHFVRATAKYGHGAMAMMSGTEQKALSEGTDTAGGFVVPPDIQAEMLVRVAQMAVMRSICRVQPTNRDTLRWPAVAAATTNGSIYSSGFVGGWAGETPAFTDTDPSFQIFDIAIKKVRVATKLSNDFVSDAAVNMLAFLAQNGAENMALVEDQGFIAGLGAALQPLGILNVPGISTTDVTGTTAHKISNTIASPLASPTGINNLFYSLPPQYAPRARWLMRRTIEGSIRALVDGQGRPIWFPWAQAGLAGDSPSNLLGAPISHTDWMPADGTASAMPLIIGDFQNYIIGQRTQITSLILRERFADTDQVGIILFERVGGGAYNTDAFRIGTVS